jgi:seryl-tRNA synthetase
VLHDFRRIKKVIVLLFLSLNQFIIDFQIKKDFMNLIICDKAHVTQVSKLENHKLGFRMVCTVS